MRQTPKPDVQRPFIHIARDQRRTFGLRIQMGNERGKLSAPRPAHQPQMGGDDAQRDIAQVEIHHHRTARLHPRQVQVLDLDQLCLGAQQDGVAMPADADLTGDGHRDQTGLRRHLIHGQRRGAGAKAHVGLLQHDDIRRERLDHAQYAGGISFAVGAHGLAHVIAGDAKGGLGHNIGAPMRKTPSARRRGKCGLGIFSWQSASRAVNQSDRVDTLRAS